MWSTAPPARPARGRRRLAGLAVLAALAAATASCSSDDEPAAQVPSSDTQAPTTSTTAIDTTTTEEPAEEVPSGRTDPEPVEAVEVGQFEAPIWIMPRPGDDHLWMAERQGRVRRVAVAEDGSLDATDDPVLDITDEIHIEFEHGLFSLAFDPEGETLFVSYTDTDGHSVVARYDVDAAGVVDEASGEQLFFLEQPYGNHNGGHLVFHDGMLWLGMGDGGLYGDPDKRAQDPGDQLGKVLRIDPDTGDAEVVVLGVRNPWRYAFDTDGSLWVADVGEGTDEEITRLPAAGIEGANLGWSGFEGTLSIDETQQSPDAIMPGFEYTHDGGNCSITGGFVYRGTAIDGLQGAFLFADWCAGNVRAVRFDDAGDLVAEYDLGINVPEPWSFGFDHDGEPFVLSTDGSVVRIVPAG